MADPDVNNNVGEGSRKRIAIIGAGVSGICSVKSCLESGLEPVCFEQSEDLGGLWRFKPGPTMQGEGTVMKGTTINTSKEMMAFSDFPPPSHFHNFMHHSQLMEYLRLYVDHFQLAPHFRFHHRITRIQRSEDYQKTGRWDVSYKVLNESQDPIVQTETFDGVMLCSGHHTYPYLPDIPGQEQFKGQIKHANEYRSTKGYEGKTVVVVGMGNSAGDIAVGLGYEVAKKVYLSARRRVWVFNRNAVFGLPYDYIYFNRFFFWLLENIPAVSNFFTTMEMNRRMDHFLFGINPEQGPYNSHPFVNDDLPRSLTSGAVSLKPGIDHLTEHEVHFTDGTTVENVDIVMMCTGYTLAFPFLEEGVIDVHENDAPLYKHMYPAHMEHPTLAVIGMIQPFGAIQAIAELQSRVFVKAMLDHSLLPPRDAMETDIKRVKQRMHLRYVTSRRHTFQVDGVPYMDELSTIIGARPPSFMEVIGTMDLAFLARMFTKGTVPYQYRLRGPDAWDGAYDAILKAGKNTLLPYTDINSDVFKSHVKKNLGPIKTVIVFVRILCFHCAKFIYPILMVMFGMFLGWLLS